jgi:excisionase family DNA binding protein
VVAPTLVPVKAGDRVKTDRRDALKLARSYRAGDLTAVWVPDAAHEALRDLVRAREAAKKDQLRARHRLGKFLLRHGRRPPTGMTSWTQRYLAWIKTAVQFEQPAQEATLLDYLHEVEHVAGRIEGLERAIDEAVRTVPARMRAVIDEAFEVAEYIGCHEETVRRAYLRGLLNSTRFGVRGRRFHPRDVLDWIRRGAPTRVS